MIGSTALLHMKVLERLKRTIWSHSSSSISSVALILGKPPALLTRTSTRSQRLTTASTARRTSAPTVTSVFNASASTFPPASSAASFSAAA